MKNVKKFLVGAAVIVGVLVIEIIIQNCTNFHIPDATFATCGAMIGMGLYNVLSEKYHNFERE